MDGFSVGSQSSIISDSIHLDLSVMKNLLTNNEVNARFIDKKEDSDSSSAAVRVSSEQTLLADKFQIEIENDVSSE